MEAASDADLLRSVPRIALASGYVDVCCTYPGLPLRDDVLRRELSSLAPELRDLVSLFALAEPVEASPVEAILGGDVLAALERLRIILRTTDGRLDSAGMRLVPFGGQLLFVPAPRGSPIALLGEDTLALATRLLPRAGASCLSLCAGPGAIALGLARVAARVVAAEDQPAALACAELNFVMNGVDDRVTLQDSFLPALAGERFDHVVANPPPLPFPRSLFAAEAGDGPGDVEAILRALPDLLDDGGVAQLVGAVLGDATGPRLPDLGLAASVIVSCQAPLARGARLFDALARNAARAGVLEAREAERRMLAHLARTRCDRLFAVSVVARHGDTGTIMSRPDTFGGGYFTR